MGSGVTCDTGHHEISGSRRRWKGDGSMTVVTIQAPGHEDEFATVGERFVRLAEHAWVSFASMVAHRQHACPPKLLGGRISFTSSARGIQLHLAMAGNFPRIPGITPSLGLVHDPLSLVTHRFALLVQSGGLAPRRQLPVAATSNSKITGPILPKLAARSSILLESRSTPMG